MLIVFQRNRHCIVENAVLFLTMGPPEVFLVVGSSVVPGNERSTINDCYSGLKRTVRLHQQEIVPGYCTIIDPKRFKRVEHEHRCLSTSTVNCFFTKGLSEVHASASEVHFAFAAGTSGKSIHPTR